MNNNKLNMKKYNVYMSIKHQLFFIIEKKVKNEMELRDYLNATYSDVSDMYYLEIVTK